MNKYKELPVSHIRGDSSKSSSPKAGQYPKLFEPMMPQIPLSSSKFTAKWIISTQKILADLTQWTRFDDALYIPATASRLLTFAIGC